MSVELSRPTPSAPDRSALGRTVRATGPLGRRYRFSGVTSESGWCLVGGSRRRESRFDNTVWLVSRCEGDLHSRRDRAMLVLSRKLGERVLVPQCGLSVTVVAIEGNVVRLGFTAPTE